MKLTSKIDSAWTTFLGSHDNGPRDHGLWCLTLTAYTFFADFEVMGHIWIQQLAKNTVKPGGGGGGGGGGIS